MPLVGFRMTRTRKIFANHPVVIKVLRAELNDEVKPHFLKIFNNYTSNWKNKVPFKAKATLTRDFIKVYVFPTANKDLWDWITNGTDPHPIVAVNVPTLKFRTGYQAKTKPKNLAYKGSGKSSGPWRSPVAVMHPGTEAREVEATVLKDEKPWFSRRMENAWRRALRKAQKAS